MENVGLTKVIYFLIEFELETSTDQASLKYFVDKNESFVFLEVLPPACHHHKLGDSVLTDFIGLLIFFL